MRLTESNWFPFGFVCLILGVCLPSTTFSQNEVKAKPSIEKLIKQLESKDNSEQIAAAAMLAEHADRIEEFVNPLAALTMSREELVRLSAERAFAFMGADAVEAIEPLVNSSQRSEFAAACNAIRAIGDDADRYRKVLFKQLSNENVNFRVAAMHALSGFSNGAEGAVEQVASNLEDDHNFNVGLFACRALIKTGPKAKAAIPALVSLMENGNVSQRTYAAWTLGAIGKNDQFETFEKLQSMLGKFTITERERALLGLGLMGSDAAEATEKVRQMMNRPGSGLEPTAALVLWQITGETRPSIDRLVELSKQVDFEVIALERLSEMNSAAKGAAGYLVSRMTADDASIREAAIDALGNIGDLTEEQKQSLTKVQIDDKDPLVRLVASMALQKIAAFEAAQK